MNSFTQSIPYVSCPSVFSDDFKVYRTLFSLMILWISSDIAFLTNPCVSHDSISGIDLMRRSWIHWRCGFHTSAVTQFSVTITRSTRTLFSVMIYGSAVTQCLWQFHASAMTLFLLSVWCVGREFIYTMDSTRQLSLSFEWWFLVLQRLSFRWRFMDQQWHSVFDNSMRQPWLYFWYRFDASIMNSFLLSIPHVSCHSVFSDDLKFYSDYVFTDDLWISRDITFSTIPCVNHDSIFAIEFVHQSWIHLLYRFHTQLSLNIHWRFKGLEWVCFRWRFMDEPWHSVFAYFMRKPWFYFSNRFDVSVVNSFTLSIPYASCHSVFIDDFNIYSDSVLADYLWITSDIIFYNFMRQPWLYFCYWFDVSIVNSLTLLIPYVTCHSVFSDDFKVYTD